MRYSKTELNDAKFFLYKSLLFIVVFLIIDLSLGSIAKRIFYLQKTGKFARITYAINIDSSEVLIMGSSHANRHYVPEILEKELNMTCYNAGVQGQGMTFLIALQKMILKRHIPKTIILNIDTDWMFKSNESYERIADLYPYYWDYKSELDPILSLYSRFVPLKLWFRAYQTNSTLVHAIVYFLHPQIDYQGYLPYYSQMALDQSSESKTSAPIKTSMNNQEIDSNLVYMLEEFIYNAEINEIDLIFTRSPRFNKKPVGEYNESLDTILSIAKSHKIPFFDFSNDSAFYMKYQLFTDPGHLNNSGAISYSKLIADTLKFQYFNSEK